MFGSLLTNGCVLIVMSKVHVSVTVGNNHDEWMKAFSVRIDFIFSFLIFASY